MKTPVSFDELDQMAAEVLPERTVMCVVAGAAGGDGGSSAAAAAGGGDDGATMLSSCTTTTSYTNPGVLGIAGAQYNTGPQTTTTCTPAAVAS